MLTGAQLRRLRRLPRSAHTWEGQALVSEGGSAVISFAAWVDVDAPTIRTVQLDRARRDPAALAVKSFARAATDPAGELRAELPARIRVRERELAVALRLALDRLGVVVEQTERLLGIWQLHLRLLEYLGERGDDHTALVAQELHQALARYHEREEQAVDPYAAASGRSSDEELESVTVAELDVEREFVPQGTRVGVGGIPWQELDEVRPRAEVRQPPASEPVARGPGLPAVTIFADPADGRRMARELRDAELQGVVAARYPRRGTLVLALTGSGRALELVRIREGADDRLARAVALFDRRTRELGGAHALLVVDGADPRDRSPAVLGLFEAVLVRRD